LGTCFRESLNEEGKVLHEGLNLVINYYKHSLWVKAVAEFCVFTREIGELTNLLTNGIMEIDVNCCVNKTIEANSELKHVN